MSTYTAPSGTYASTSTQTYGSLNITKENLEPIIDRIKQIIRQIKLTIPSHNINLSKIICPITYDTPKDPVVTNCGHIYERTTIEAWKKNEGACTLCNSPINTLSPIIDLRELINSWKEEDPIPTFSDFIESNQTLASIHLEAAKASIEKGFKKAALESYRLAFHYTNASEIYSVIPLLYYQLGDSIKANLASLFLSMYQLQEGKTEEAIKTLETSKQSSLSLGLKLHMNPSTENIGKAMKDALTQYMGDERIFILKQILAYAPTHFEVYKHLIALTKNGNEKRALAVKAAELAHQNKQLELETFFRKEAGIYILPKMIHKTVIARKEWANAEKLQLPPYPKDLQEFLEGNCTIWSGKQRFQTHIVVPLFPDVDLNDEGKSSTPLTVKTFDLLNTSTGGPGLIYAISNKTAIPNITAKRDFGWGVMTNDFLPGSRNKSYAMQKQLLPVGYTAPGIFDAIRAILWEHRRADLMYFTDETSTRCREQIEEGRWLIVGNFKTEGLEISSNKYDFEEIGLAGWREF
jgi:hypothetical protein